MLSTSWRHSTNAGPSTWSKRPSTPRRILDDRQPAAACLAGGGAGSRGGRRPGRARVLEPVMPQGPRTAPDTCPRRGRLQHAEAMHLGGWKMAPIKKPGSDDAVTAQSEGGKHPRGASTKKYDRQPDQAGGRGGQTG